MLSTFDTVTNAKIPILYKIFPGLRAMTTYVPSESSLNPIAKQLCNLATRIGGSPLRSQDSNLFQKTTTDSQSQYANRPLPLPRLNLPTSNLQLLLLPPLVHLITHRRRRLLLGRKIHRLALPRRREIILVVWQSVAGLWVRRPPERIGVANGH